MSMRHILNEFRPLFRMLEEPLSRPSPYFGHALRARPSSLFDDPFFNTAASRPAVDLSEDGNQFIVEADMPGIQKENIEVKVGDGGHTVTISGKTSSTQNSNAPTTNEGTGAAAVSGENTQSVVQSKPNQISSERQLSTHAQFTRTVWLPQSVDGSRVAAKLKDGVLTVTIPKVEEKGTVVVPVE